MPDPKSNEPNFQTDLTHRFEAAKAVKSQLARTLPLNSVKAEDYGPVFYPGGHGPMWDLTDDSLHQAHRNLHFAGKTRCPGLPCACLASACQTVDRKPLVAGNKATVKDALALFEVSSALANVLGMSALHL